jgi:hypothetical protein
MFNRLFVLLISLLFFLNESHAQNKGILPLTGIHYFAEGISAKNIEVKVDAATLISNRIPLNKSFEIRLQSPAGFTTDRSNMIFAAAELNIVSLKGEILSNIPNIFKDSEAKGFASNTFKELIVNISLKPEQLRSDAGCTIKIRYYDLKSKNQLRMEFPVSIAGAGEAVQVSKLINDIKTANPSQAKSIGLKIRNLDVSVDTTIRVSPKMAYASLDISNIEGTGIAEVLSGKESFWVFDDNLNEIKITDKQLKQVGGAMENNVVNYLSKIPFRLKTTLNRKYTVRFRWESSDKRKIIDVVAVK